MSTHTFPFKALVIMSIPALVGLGFGAVFPKRNITIAEDHAGYTATIERSILGVIPTGVHTLPNLKRVDEASRISLDRHSPGDTTSKSAQQNTVVFLYGAEGKERHAIETGTSVEKSISALQDVLTGKIAAPQTIQMSSFIMSMFAPLVAILFTAGIWFILIAGWFADRRKARVT